MQTNFSTILSDHSEERIKAENEQCWKKVVTRTEKAESVVVVNVALIGNSNAGKTALIKQYCYQGQHRGNKLTTLGIEVEPVWVKIDSQVVKVKIWDTAG